MNAEQNRDDMIQIEAEYSGKGSTDFLAMILRTFPVLISKSC